MKEISCLPKRFSEKVDFSGDCWLWTAYKHKTGYGNYVSEGKKVRAHRFSWEHFNGKIPGGLHVLHKCDTPACVNPSHLFLGTQQDNMDDKVAKGRSSYGENNRKAKLTNLQVDEIRRVYKKGSNGEFSTVGLSEKFGISTAQISKIVNKKSWTKSKFGGVTK